MVALQRGKLFKRDHSLNRRRVTQSPGPIQSLIFIYLWFYFVFSQGSWYREQLQWWFSVLWISIDCAVEGPVLISHQTPLHSCAFQALLNWDKFDPGDENLNCNVSPWISFRKREDSEAQGLWDDLEDKSTPTTHFKSQQLDCAQPRQLVLEQVRWVPASSSSI